MLYYVKNRSGNVSDVTEEMYEYLKTKEEYEAWTEDPYENLPEEVLENSPVSTDYTVREALEVAEGMNRKDLEAFIAEDEERVTITRLLD